MISMLLSDDNLKLSVPVQREDNFMNYYYHTPDYTARWAKQETLQDAWINVILNKEEIS